MPLNSIATSKPLSKLDNEKKLLKEKDLYPDSNSDSLSDAGKTGSDFNSKSDPESELSHSNSDSESRSSHSNSDSESGSNKSDSQSDSDSDIPDPDGNPSSDGESRSDSNSDSDSESESEVNSTSQPNVPEPGSLIIKPKSNKPQLLKSNLNRQRS